MSFKIGTNQFGEIITEAQPIEATCRVLKCLKEGETHHRLICKEWAAQPELVAEREIPYLGEILAEADIQE